MRKKLFSFVFSAVFTFFAYSSSLFADGLYTSPKEEFAMTTIFKNGCCIFAVLWIVLSLLIILQHKLKKPVIFGKISIHQIMIKDPTVIDAKTPIEKAFKLMKKLNIISLPVVKEDPFDKTFVGMLSLQAIENTFANKNSADSIFYNTDFASIKSMEIVDKNAPSLDLYSHLDKAIELMINTGCGYIPVVNDSNAVCGMLTRFEVIKSLKRFFM